MFSHHISSCLAGDPQVLLVVIHYSGLKESELIDRTLPFYNKRIDRLRKKLESRIRRTLVGRIKLIV